MGGTSVLPVINMIVRDKKKKSGLWKIDYKGEKFIMTHAERIDPIINNAQEIKTYSDNGWSKDRNFRQIGCIPSSVLLKHPEFMQDSSLLKKWLMSEEGAPYRTVNRLKTR